MGRQGEKEGASVSSRRVRGEDWYPISEEGSADVREGERGSSDASKTTKPK